MVANFMSMVAEAHCCILIMGKGTLVLWVFRRAMQAMNSVYGGLPKPHSSTLSSDSGRDELEAACIVSECAVGCLGHLTIAHN